MQSIPLPVLGAAVLGMLAAAAALSVAVVASLRGGESKAAARRLAPLTVSPAIVVFLLGSLTIDGTAPMAAPLAGLVVTVAVLVGLLRSLWRTRATPSERRKRTCPAD